MKKKQPIQAYVDAGGRIVLPKELTARLGLAPGSKVPIAELKDGVHLRRPATQLAKVYIEPTSRCNLSCRTCVRNTWDEAQGDMSQTTFKKIMAGLRKLKPKPAVFFGGLGEPLAHPDILKMVRQARRHASKLELITNGMLLDEKVARELIDIGLDVLWLSIDGARPESYNDVRLGAALPQVLENVARLRDLRAGGLPRIGIVFVAMRRNIAELPDVIQIGHRLEADRFLVTNVIPYTPELLDEMLYTDTMSIPAPAEPSALAPHVQLTRIDFSEATIQPIFRIMRAFRAPDPADSGLAPNRCPFIASGSTAIAWNGSVSPCLPLLHTHASYFGDRRRISRCCVMGNVNDEPLEAIWGAPEYLGLRERVQAFEFSPCTFCGGCTLSKSNEEDCLGNPFPTCGGCLWAQGVIRCP